MHGFCLFPHSNFRNATTDLKSVDSIRNHIDTNFQTDAGKHSVATFFDKVGQTVQRKMTQQ
ncbi:hypothetical protein DPMN_073224 [Dreissena polymorpha]|uniref:Uncharacterized protein n=1 Tax=Dreissena polymorpha TaxID=45954 RepID=A0A9D4BYS4_DREPO|nr:hypothetical protein DPMN_073224 [Dreissena polymorpha]